MSNTRSKIYTLPYLQVLATALFAAAPLAALDPVPSAGLRELRYEHYKGVWEKLPNFDELKPTREKALPAGRFMLESEGDRNHFGLRFSSKLLVPADGEYLFSLDSDDGTRLLLDGKVIVDHDGVHGGNNPKTNTVTLKKGTAKLELQ